jgi:hypothetical protein
MSPNRDTLPRGGYQSSETLDNSCGSAHILPERANAGHSNAQHSEYSSVDDSCFPRWRVPVNVVGRAHPFSRFSGSRLGPRNVHSITDTLEGKTTGKLHAAASHAVDQVDLRRCSAAFHRRLSRIPSPDRRHNRPLQQFPSPTTFALSSRWTVSSSLLKTFRNHS